MEFCLRENLVFRVPQPADVEVEEAISEGESNDVLGLAVTEAKRLFAVTGVSLAAVCTAVEGTSSKVELQETLGRFYQILHIFWSSSPMTWMHETSSLFFGCNVQVITLCFVFFPFFFLRCGLV